MLSCGRSYGLFLGEIHFGLQCDQNICRNKNKVCGSFYTQIQRYNTTIKP